MIIEIRLLTLTVSPSQASVTSQSASRCNRLASTSVRLFGWLFQRKQNCWSIVGASVSDRAASLFKIVANRLTSPNISNSSQIYSNLNLDIELEFIYDIW